MLGVIAAAARSSSVSSTCVAVCEQRGLAARVLAHKGLVEECGSYLRLCCDFGALHLRLHCGVGASDPRLRCGVGALHLSLCCNFGALDLRRRCGFGAFDLRLRCDFGALDLCLRCGVGALHFPVPKCERSEAPETGAQKVELKARDPQDRHRPSHLHKLAAALPGAAREYGAWVIAGTAL